MLGSRKFAIGWILYMLASLAIFFGAAFTSAAWIVYGLVLIPVYCCCLLYCLSLSVQHPRSNIGFRKSAWYAIIGTQVSIVLTSPADCYGWHQGRACYSFIQTYLDRTALLYLW
jgi:hypothetical protein